MKKKGLSLIVAILILALYVTPVYAESAMSLTVATTLADKDSGSNSRNLVTPDCFLYYSFYDNGTLNLQKNGDEYSFDCKGYSYANPAKTGTIEVPAISYKGKEEVSGGTHKFVFTGTIGGPLTSSRAISTGTIHYTFNVSNIRLEISYKESQVKDGVVTADAKMLYDVKSSNDGNETTQNSTDTKNFNVKEFKLTGVSGAAAGGTAKSSTKASTATPASSTAQVTQNNDNKGGFPVGVVVGGVIVIGGGAAAAVVLTKKSPKKVVDTVTGEEKTYNYDDNTGEYVSEDGSTTLNTEIIDDVARQAEKDREFANEQMRKLQNRDTVQDTANKKMAADHAQTVKDVEREIYIEKVATKRGVQSTDMAGIKNELGAKQAEAVKNAEDRAKIAANWDVAVKAAEVTEKAADIAITVGETYVPGGKAVSATYKGVKSVATSVATDGFDLAKNTSAAIRGAADAANVYTGGWTKAGVTVGSEVGAEVAEAAVKGESITGAIGKGVAKGSAKAMVSAAGDAVGDATGAKATSSIVADTYQSKVVDPNLEKKLK